MAATIESIFDDIGGFGMAQLVFIFCIFYTHIGASWSMMQMAFAVMVPDWHCVEYDDFPAPAAPQLPTNESQQQPSEMCSVNGSTCARFTFFGSENTIVREWSLICSRKWIPSTMISIQMGGVLVGAVLAGQISERWGRRKSFVLASVWHTCANLAAAFSPNWQLFTACRFLIGVGIGGIYTISFPYSMEFLPLKTRGRVAVFPFWTLGVAIFVGVAYFLPDWRHLHLTCAAFCLPGFALCFIVPESIRWLTVVGRLDEAMDAVAKMARFNGKPVPVNARSTLETIYVSRKEHSDDMGKSYSYLDLFRGAYFIKCSMVMCFMWSTMSLISYGISFGVHGLAGNLYLNILLTNCVEIPGLLPVLWIMDRFGRKIATMLSFGVIFITTTIVLIMRVKGCGDNDKAIFWFAMVTKLCIDNVWNVIQAWVSELYPTVTRALGYGVATTSARIGGMLAPFLVDLKSRVVMTYAIISTLSLAVVLLALVLPETRLLALRDSLASTTVTLDSEDKHDLDRLTEADKGHRTERQHLENGDGVNGGQRVGDYDQGNHVMNGKSPAVLV